MRHHAPASLWACLFPWTRVASPYEPSLVITSQPQPVQPMLFVSLGLVEAG
jgi:hypothetical protein